MSNVTGESRRGRSCTADHAPMTAVGIETQTGGSAQRRGFLSTRCSCTGRWPRPLSSHLNGTRSTMIAVLGCLASALSIAVVWPQVGRSCRHRRTLGLSPTSAWLAVGLNVCWLTFGALTGDPAQMITNAVVGTGNCAVLAALLLTQPQLRTRAVRLRTAAGAAGLLALAAGSALTVTVLGASPAVVATTLSSVIALVGSIAAVPQPLRLLRDRTQ